jgi:hypothetical protein
MHPLPDGAHAVGAPLRPPSGRPPLRAHRVTRASLNPVPRRPLTESLIDPPYHPHIQHADLAITSRYLRGIDNTEIIQAVRQRPEPMIPAGRELLAGR